MARKVDRAHYRDRPQVWTALHDPRHLLARRRDGRDPQPGVPALVAQRRVKPGGDAPTRGSVGSRPGSGEHRGRRRARYTRGLSGAPQGRRPRLRRRHRRRRPPAPRPASRAPRPDRRPSDHPRSPHGSIQSSRRKRNRTVGLSPMTRKTTL